MWPSGWSVGCLVLRREWGGHEALATRWASFLVRGLVQELDRHLLLQIPRGLWDPLKGGELLKGAVQRLTGRPAPGDPEADPEGGVGPCELDAPFHPLEGEGPPMHQCHVVDGCPVY